MTEHSSEREPLSPRWEFVRIVRQPSGFGVAKMTVRHGEHGSVVVDLMPTELHDIATQALAAMVAEAAHSGSRDGSDG